MTRREIGIRRWIHDDRAYFQPEQRAHQGGPQAAPTHAREQFGSFLVEGIRLVSEAVQSASEVSEIIVAPDLLKSRFALDLVEAERTAGKSICYVSADVFASISDRDHPQGLAAVATQRWQSLERLSPTDQSLWVALDSVADPGNLGTIVRTADAVGATGVMLVGHSTDPFDPAAVRASMGSIFTLQVVRTTARDLVNWTRQHRVLLVGTSPAATSEYQDVDYQRPLVLLMGSEREGLDEEMQHACDRLVRLPMVGRADSLNLAVATGVVLYEVLNQWRRGPTKRKPVQSRRRSTERRRPSAGRRDESGDRRH